MDGFSIFILIIFFGIFALFIYGNSWIIIAIYEGNVSCLKGEEFSVFVAVVADLIILFLVCKKIMPTVSASFQLMRTGLKNRKITKKESAKLKKLLKNEKPDMNRLEELRAKRISEGATKRTLHFCQLIETIAGKEHLQACLSEVGERQSVLDEIDDIESRIFKIAESYKNAGDTEKCQYYLDILKSTNIITPEITALENECEALLYSRDAERKAIWLWRGIFLGALTFLIAVSVVFYINDTPNRKFRSMIKNQSLTAEMCSRENRNSEDSYYDYLISEKGYKLLASELSKLHRDNDINKAMWLLCVQPNIIDLYHLCASPYFAKWIIEYAKNNGVRSIDQDEPDDSWYNVTYSVDGYDIIIRSYDDKETDLSNIREFVISDSKNRAIIHVNKHCEESTIPTIK